MSLLLKKKGGKSFAPKIPQKRSGAPSSTQSSARPSVERLSNTPAPHHIDIVTIPDEDGTPAPSDEPSRIIENNPSQHLLENSNDTLLRTHEATIQNISKRAVIPPDKDSLKRKTRDQDAAVEIASKRHQLSSLDTPRSPVHANQRQIAETRSQIQDVPRSFSDSTHTDINIPGPLQPCNAGTGALDTRLSKNGEVFGSAGQLLDSSINSSHRHPLPDTARNSRSRESPEITTNDLGPAGDVGAAAAGRQLAQTPVIVPMAPLNPDGTPGDLLQHPVTAIKKKLPKRRKVQQGEDGDDVRATIEMQLNRPRRPSGKRSEKRKKDDRKKGKRGETPDGAEHEEINTVEIKMVDLTKDLRIGKKFSIHDELRQREKDKIIKAQLMKTHPELVAAMAGAEGAEGATSEIRGEVVRLESGGPKMKVVDGQIVVDQESMQLDRQGRARAEQGEIEAVVENDFSKMTTSGTHMKRERAQFWDMAANEIFWKGLRMFGTDFEMIAKMFPHRNRRQIKLKFNKEEKDNPAKVDRILKGAGSAIELDTYEELSGFKLEEVEAIEAEREKLKAEQFAEEQKRIADHAIAEKRKKEAIDAARDTPRGVDDGSGEKENQPRSLSSKGGQQEGEKTLVRAKKAPRSRKDGNVPKPRKKPGADETVQVLGDA